MKGRPSRMAMYPPELNLIPLLDMVSLLIQLMLVNAQFGVYAEIAAKMAGAVEPAEAEAALELEVTVTKDGYDLSWNDAGARTVRQLACQNACASPADFDVAGLAALATELDARHPAENTVIVRPVVGIPFETLVATMDALRGPEGEGSRFPDVVLAGAAR